MGGKKTRDGIRLSVIVRLLAELSGVQIRDGRNHPHIAMADGMRTCPIATSTNARRMLVPWIARVTGYTPRNIYSSLKSGEWYNS
jgi:hypothetical protein